MRATAVKKKKRSATSFSDDHDGRRNADQAMMGNLSVFLGGRRRQVEPELGSGASSDQVCGKHGLFEYYTDVKAYKTY
jgi:hypothetical protein